MDPNAVICVKCGVKAGTGNRFCPNCGRETIPEAAACTNCGAGYKDIKFICSKCNNSSFEIVHKDGKTYRECQICGDATIVKCVECRGEDFEEIITLENQPRLKSKLCSNKC